MQNAGVRVKDYATIIREINREKQANVPSLKIAEILEVISASGGTSGVWWADIQFDDISAPVEGVYGLSSYVPKVGDIVRVLTVPGGGPLILGTVWGTHSQPSNITQTFAVFGGSSNYTSLTYVNLLGTTTPITQHFDGGMGAINVRVRGTCYCAQATTIMMLGVQINGTDYDLAPFFFNTALQHHTVTGERLITGLPAGDHAVQTRIKITGGTAVTKQITFDTSDSLTVTVEECIRV